MISTLLSILAFLVFIGMIAWFALLHALLKRLESAHPVTFEAMGRPRILEPWTSAASVQAILNFIDKREHRELRDSYLSKLSDFARIYFVVYALMFCGFFFLLAFQGR